MSELYPVLEKSIADLQAAMAAGEISSAGLVAAYLDRIEAIDRSGPTLRSIIALNSKALDEARRLDDERRAGALRGPLHGVPVLVKDNIDTDDGTATTAGSLALIDNITLRDAPVVARLKAAGAVILGKTNLSEWANIRCTRAVSGWSAVGGLVRNPYVLDRSPSGSSSGTGAAIAASLAAAGVGTETNGSVIAPASVCGLVGLKPTVGLVSRTHVVPITSWQDTPGPMGRCVADVAILLTAMAGADPADPATAAAGDHARDYAAALDGDGLKGRRLGVLGFAKGLSAAVDAVFAEAMATLRAQGAEIVEPIDYKRPDALTRNARAALIFECKTDLNAYLASTPAAVKARSLADVMDFNRASAREMVLFSQDYFELVEATRGINDETWAEARRTATQLAGPEGIDRLIAEHRLEALIAPTSGPASRIDFVTGDHTAGRSSGLPAICGYPHLTVPMGQVQGLPVGLSFIGPAWSEARLLAFGHAFEQAAQGRRPPTYIPSLEMTVEAELASAPNR